MEPIAVYEATWFEGRFTFELFVETIHVKGCRFLQSQVDASIPLADLPSRVDRIWVQPRSFAGGLTTAVLGLVGYVLLTRAFLVDPLNPAAILLGLIGAVGCLVAVATIRKQEYAQFVSDAGVPVLSIPRSARRGHGDFDQFVQQLTGKVQESKRAHVN